MAVSNPSILGGHVVDLEDVIKALDDELVSAPQDPLSEAVRRGEEQAILEHSLVQKGLSSLPSKRLAIRTGRPDLLHVLLEQDNLIEEDLVAAACTMKDRACIRKLLDFGWPVNDAVGYDASMLGLAIDDVELMQWLIDNGADVNARSTLDESALSKAIVCGNIDVVRFLLAEGTDTQHGNLLHCAAQRRNQLEGATMIRELVQKGADLNAYRFDDPVAFRWRAPFKLLTPLHVACREANVPVAQALLELGANPYRKMLEAGEATGKTALELALASEKQSLVDLFTQFNDRALTDVPGNY